MGPLEIVQFPCRTDNIGVLMHDPKTGATASIDAPDGDVICAALEAQGWPLTHLFTTHHHFDHVAGHEMLKDKYGARIIAPLMEADKIPGVDEAVRNGDTVTFGSFTVQVIETPGHTLGQVNYFLPQAKLAFTGDTLFALGCGRVFEGTHSQMWSSLQKLKTLPMDTQIYCGHEYTLPNAEFALMIDPDNPALMKRVDEIRATRAKGCSTLPTMMGLELQTNPFLRTNSPAIRRHLGMQAASDEAVFSELRTRKDQT